MDGETGATRMRAMIMAEGGGDGDDVGEEDGQGQC